jgi:hypothetical protein
VFLVIILFCVLLSLRSSYVYVIVDSFAHCFHVWCSNSLVTFADANVK